MVLGEFRSPTWRDVFRPLCGETLWLRPGKSLVRVRQNRDCILDGSVLLEQGSIERSVSNGL